MKISNPVRLGLAMEGMEEQIGSLIVRVCSQFERPTYVEIGVAEARTLIGISNVLADLSEDWRSVGVELPNGYSFNEHRAVENAKRNGFSMDIIYSLYGAFSPPWNKISLVLKDAHTFFPEHWGDQINIALIDGCHGRDCATLDFLLIEPHIVKGGVVMFHDFGEDQQGQEQPHCKNGIDVRGACADLGLLENTRPGWKWVCTIVGDKHKGSADMGVFQRV